MGLWARIRQLVGRGNADDRRRGYDRRRQDTEEYRRCRFEAMEPRRLLDADPIRLGAIYIEEDSGADLHGDTFEITFAGGAANTQLTQLVISGDQDSPGFGTGDVFFDTVEGARGADHASPFQIVSLQTQDPNASVHASVEDGTTTLTLDFQGFKAGDKLRFTIDVDEVEDFDPAETDYRIINDGFDPITSGVEFQSSRITAHFSAPHYYDANGDSRFINRYDESFNGSGLNLPADDFEGKRDRSDGAIVKLTQAPLPISISGKVYLEKNLDLVQDSGENGIANVELALWQKQGSTYVATGLTTRTDAQGRYEFGTSLNLLPGTYQVRETQPTGLFSVGAIPGSVDGVMSGTVVTGNRDILTEISIPLGGQQSIHNDFAEAEPAKLSGYVYHDRSDDGVRDSGEEGLRDVAIQIIPISTIAEQAAVTVRTNSAGYYEAVGLAPGSYRVVEPSQPVGYFDGLDTPGTVNGLAVGTVSNPGDSLEQILLAGGQVGVNYNFGELIPASLRGRVGFADRNGDCSGLEQRPIADATIRLLDSTGKLIAETRTNADGEYEFTGLRPGEYSVVELTPDGLIDGDSHPGDINGVTEGQAGTGVISQIFLGSGQQGIEFNFCENVPASISGYTYHDENNNGVMDQGETPIGGVKVTLRDASGAAIDSAETDSLGFYEFVGLPAGTYAVVETQPTGWLDGTDAAGEVNGNTVGQATNPGDRISQIEVLWGDESIRNDFGELLPGSISGHVHLDTNGNCIADPGETMLEGVTIQLLDVDGKVLRTTQTDADGFYEFTDLAPGTYGVREIQPQGVFQGGQTAGSNGGDDSQTDQILQVAIGSGQMLVNYDFCEVPPASIAGMVFVDPNHDCFYNDGDSPLPTVTVELLNEQDQVVATTTTDAQGRYKFENLAPGVYSVRETQPSGYYQGGQTAGTGGGDVFTEDLIGNILIFAGDELVEYNFCEVPPGSLAGTVFLDPNRDLVINSGDTRLADVTVELLDENGDVVATQKTDADGHYLFDQLAPGTYSVRETQPTQYFEGGERLGSGGGQTTKNLFSEVVIGGGEHLVAYDFAEVPPARIAGYVFQDGKAISGVSSSITPEQIGQLRDGKFTADDTPILGVTLQLRDGFTGQTIDASEALPGLYAAGPIQVKTDAQGHYEFKGIPGGRSYAVYEVHPTDYVDGIDTVGTTTGFAFNQQSLQQITIEPLAGQPASDAIIRIAVAPGGVSENNNFSEVKVENTIIPPSNPPTPVTFPPPKVTIPPLLEPSTVNQTRTTPMVSNVSWISPRQQLMTETFAGSLGYSWHLSVVNGGMPRDIASASETADEAWTSVTHLDQTNWAVQDMDQARWVLGANLQISQSQKTNGRTFVFGVRGATPFAGDFNGDGQSEVGIFYRGEWFVDLNGNGVWDEGDLWAKLGDEFDRPVVGDWDGDGKDDIGIYGPEWLGDHRQMSKEQGLPDSQNLTVAEGKVDPKNLPPNREDATDGHRLLRLNSNGPRRADVIDHVLRYGEERDVPVTGDWNGDGIRTVGIFHGGKWRLDADGDGLADSQDRQFHFGAPGDLPVVGDWDGNGVEEIGIYRSGKWILDVNGNHELDAHDRIFELGGSGDRPVVGDWNGDGVDEPAIYRELPESAN